MGERVGGHVGYMCPYGTYVTAVLESRLYFQFKSTARGVTVPFVVSSCDSKFNVLDLPAQCLKTIQL